MFYHPVVIKVFQYLLQYPVPLFAPVHQRGNIKRKRVLVVFEYKTVLKVHTAVQHSLFRNFNQLVSDVQVVDPGGNRDANLISRV